MGISRLNPSEGGIPYGNTSGRPSASLGKLYSNGEIGRLEMYTSNGWQNIVQETPGVSSASGTYSQTSNQGTFIISGTNFVDGAIAYAIGTNNVEYQATTTTYNSIVQLTTVFQNLSAAYEPYDIKIVNPSNLFGLLPDAFVVNDYPLWVTAGGSLGAYSPGQSVSVQLSATDDENNALTYSLSSGSLPTGLSLSSSGLISGTISAGSTSQTFNFTISVSDGINSAQPRAFSITYNVPTLTGGALTSDSTYYYRTFASSGSLVIADYGITADILAIAGGGGGAGQRGGGGGAGGVLYLTSQNLGIGTNVVTVGGGGPASAAGGGQTGTSGGPSQVASLAQAIGGGGGGGDGGVGGTSGLSGGSGGGACNYNGAVGGSGVAGPPRQGYDGGGRSGQSPNYGAGGGGGAGANGNPGNENAPGTGGAGTNSYSSILSAISSVMSGVSGWSSATSGGYIAGGGAGGYYQSTSGIRYSGGVGGGGRSGASGGNPGESGVTNTGSGGGGGWNGGNDVAGGNGGAGLVVIRYTKSQIGA